MLHINIDHIKINPRTSGKDGSYLCIALSDTPHDGSVSLTVRNIPAVKTLLSSESLHTLHTSPADSYLGQSNTMLSLDIVVNIWLLHYHV